MSHSPGPDPVIVRTRDQLDALAPAIGATDAGARAVVEVVDDLTRDRAPASAYRVPRWSGVGDDCSPFEWSLAFRAGAVDLRLLVEAQSDPASPAGYWAAGRALTQDLSAALGADTSRLQAIEDLYAPRDGGADPTFVLWHGVEWRDPVGDRPPRVKLYLNPATADPAPEAVMAVVAETYRRLGFDDAWAALAPRLADAPPSHVSIDLDASDAGRLKLYLRVRDVEGAASLYALGATAHARDVPDVVAALSGHDPVAGARLPRPGFVVLHHTDTAASAPARSVLNLQVPSLCGDDRTALDRVGALLTDHGLSAERHADAVTALAADSFLGASPFRAAGSDPVAGQSRLQSYVSFQREPEGARITTYFGLRAFAARFGWRADDPVTMWPSPVTREDLGSGR